MGNVTLRQVKQLIIGTEYGDIVTNYLGRGMFSTAWREAIEGKDVYLITEDTAKEIYRETRSDSPHIPPVEYVGYAGRNEAKSVVKMPYYEKLTAKHKEAWKQAKILQKAADITWQTFVMPRLAKRSYVSYSEAAREVAEFAKREIPESLYDALDELLGTLANYGDEWFFEFQPSNLGVDDQGRLILRDIIFNVDAVGQKRGLSR